MIEWIESFGVQVGAGAMGVSTFVALCLALYQTHWADKWRRAARWAHLQPRQQAETVCAPLYHLPRSK